MVARAVRLFRGHVLTSSAVGLGPVLVIIVGCGTIVGLHLVFHYKVDGADTEFLQTDLLTVCLFGCV